MSLPDEPIHSDSEDETSINIVGDIPLEWYDEFDHIGYKADGSKLIPKERQDILDEVIRKSSDPNWWRRYYDKREGTYKTITAEDLDLVSRLRSGEVGIRGYNYYQPFYETEWKDKIHPLTNKMLSKKHFQPSRSSLYKITQIMAKMREQEAQEEEEKPEKEAVDIWSDDFYVKPQKRRGLPPPKQSLPSTEDSYHPPDDENPHRLLEVDGYDKAVLERYERCCDLFLAPREQIPKRPETSAELLPEIPDVEELKPFPTAEAVRFVGHTGRVRCAELSPDGSIMVSGSSDGELKYWETMTGRCLKTIDLGKIAGGENKAVTSVVYCPNTETPFVVATCNKYVFLIRRREGDVEFPDDETGKSEDEEERPKETPEFKVIDNKIVSLSFSRVTEMRQVTFDRTGKFLAVLAQSRLVYIFNVTRGWQFKTPIAASNAFIQRIAFHPTKHHFFCATQHNILVFDLKEKKKLLRLRPLVQWISSIDVHPRGDHVIAGSYDGRSFWFDTELKTDPYKVLRGHAAAIRDVSYHKKFPLFAVACDDCKIDVFHGKVFNDLLTLPQIVPVKELNGHKPNGILGVLYIIWHPNQPWLISCGADHSIRLWS